MDPIGEMHGEMAMPGIQVMQPMDVTPGTEAMAPMEEQVEDPTKVKYCRAFCKHACGFPPHKAS